MKNKISLILLLFLFFASVVNAQSSNHVATDTIRTKTGATFIGQIVSENSQKIKIETTDFGIVSISRKDIQSNLVSIKTIGGNEIYGELSYEDNKVMVIKTKNLGNVSVEKKDIVTISNKKDSFSSIKKNAISLNVAGATPVAGILFERLLSQKFSLEFGLGFISIGGGLKFFPFNAKSNTLLFHTGISASAFVWSEDSGPITYIPFGVSFFGKNNFNFGIDVGPGFSTESDNYFYGSLKLGFRI